jgi:hypothetical protein
MSLDVSTGTLASTFSRDRRITSPTQGARRCPGIRLARRLQESP